MKLDRRRALGFLGMGLSGGLAGRAAAQEQEFEGTPAFLHGVASGDPLTTKVVIWTRVSGVTGPVWVEWMVATDPEMKRIVSRANYLTTGRGDYTVKVDVWQLRPGREYFYAFRVGGVTSPVGRTRTLPRTDSVAPVTLAAVSCSLHPAGLFNVYRAISRLEKLDAVVHLGDYIYEYGGAPDDYGVSQGKGLNRAPQPMHECVTLDDYRARHAQYKTDPDLQAAHARAPWIAVFDDHEICNDPWKDGAENHNAGEGTWADRKAAALTAYFEWMPIRWPGRFQTLEQVDRSFRFGQVASLHMVETRLQARSKQLDYDTDLVGADGQPDLPGFMRRLADPERRLLGEAQLEQLASEVGRAVRNGVAWQVFGNQVVMARVKGPDLAKAVGSERLAAAFAGMEPARRARLEMVAALFAHDMPLNLDAWDGYPAERERFYAMLTKARARALVLSGDSHSAWVNQLHDAQGKRVGVEFGATAVTSPAPGYGGWVPGMDLKPVIVEQSPEVLHLDVDKGFTLLTLTPTDATAELVTVSTIAAADFTVGSNGRFRVRPEPAGVGAVEAL